ncbi:unnamed protein product [Prorocentrum cordatum]|uniref:phosphoserine phosphatase n=1 Tax=Prorocentrum cordatum TaxID=2364126 RepID=A0ABN9VJC3_9DINO|nr:unnamed protein product [Polarella glacialis]
MGDAAGGKPGAAAECAGGRCAGTGEGGGGGGGGRVLVFRGWGEDKPGIAGAFMAVVARHQCRPLDMTQFLLEGTLMFTFVLKVLENAEGLMRDVAACADERGLQLDFHFAEADQLEARDAGGDNEVAISVVSPEPISPALLYDLDGVLLEHGCAVHQINHRSDNKRDNNGEYNKVSMRVSCPRGLKLTSLIMGAPLGGGAARSGLQRVAWDHGAEVTARWWDAMNRPNGKSLVVFGFSHVLCPYDVLDELLRIAGVDVEEALAGAPGEPAGLNQRKVSLLQGKPAELLSQVNPRLTPGAELVCWTLKRMGFTLAILTNTGCRSVVESVKRRLGIDYVICRDLEVAEGRFTGRYAGELTDVLFRKSDVLKLMADREKIEYKNVIAVGEPLKGLKAANARLVMETFGPMVYFNSQKQRDLTVALYLLGFNGTDVAALRRERREEKASAFAPPPRSAFTLFVVKVTSRLREPGQLRRILEPLAKPQGQSPPQVEVALVKQCSLQDGGICLGLHLRMQAADPEQAMACFSRECKEKGFQVQHIEHRTASTTEMLWRHYFQSRHIITMVQMPHISSATLRGVLQAMAAHDVNCVRIDKLSTHDLVALQLTVNLPGGLEVGLLRRALAEVSNEHGGDIAFQKDGMERWMRRLVVFDIESLIEQEVMDSIAKCAGVEEETRAITERAQRGELNFFDALKASVELLRGRPAEPLFRQVRAGLTFTPGARRLCSTLKRLGYKIAVVSGSFQPLVQEVQGQLGLDYAFANTLEVDETTGCLTGATSGPVVTPQRKRALLATIANVEGCEVSQTIAVGESAKDIPMLNAAGLGIAFCAKPKVQAATELRINQRDLSTVLFLLGVSEYTAERLAAQEE